MSSIGVSGGTTVYIRQIGSDIQFSTNELIWTTFTFPCTVLNTDISGGNVIVSFSTDITLTSVNDYFICGSTNLQFGSSSLKNDGTRPIITIDGVTDYMGLVENGTSSSNGYNDIKIINLEVLSTNGSTLQSVNPNFAGWIGQSYYAKGANSNFITNCSTDGDIPIYCGGIVGGVSGSDSGYLSISGCNSTGSIGSVGGGIVAISAGANSGNVIVQSCWSSGTIDTGGGGIMGNGAQNATISSCYSTGLIGQQSGGICGQAPGRSGGGIVYISNCYSTGNIGQQGGGIVGNFSGTVNVSNCYSFGDIANSQGGGICGVTNVGGQTISNCYACGTQSGGTGYITGSQSVVNGTYTLGTVSTLTNNYSEAANASSGWNDTNAKSVLTGDPSTTSYGTSWIQPNGTNTPFLVTNSGYSPYSLQLLKIVSQTVNKGSSTPAGVISGYTYSILSINGLSPSSYSTISIDSSTGEISTTSSTEVRLYTIMVYSTKNPYSITQYGLTVSDPNPPGPTPKPKKRKPVIYFNNTRGTTTIIRCKKCKPITFGWCL